MASSVVFVSWGQTEMRSGRWCSFKIRAMRTLSAACCNGLLIDILSSLGEKRLSGFRVSKGFGSSPVATSTLSAVNLTVADIPGADSSQLWPTVFLSQGTTWIACLDLAG